jgi:hypothetical protein
MVLMTGVEWIYPFSDAGLNLYSIISTAAFTGLGSLWMYMTWRSGEKMFALNKKKSFQKRRIKDIMY